MAPPALGRPHRDLEVVLAEQALEAVVDFREAALHHGEVVFLDHDALAQLLKAADGEGDEARGGRVAERFFPLFFGVEAVGAEEGDGVFGELVVEVGVEGGGWGEGIPFLSDEADLFGDGFLAWLEG